MTIAHTSRTLRAHFPHTCNSLHSKDKHTLHTFALVYLQKKSPRGKNSNMEKEKGKKCAKCAECARPLTTTHAWSTP